MTLSQIGWAADQDWFVRVSEDGKGVVVIHEILWEELTLRTFHDFAALREWAGY